MSQAVTITRFLRLTARGVTLHCPRCGGGSIVKNWWSLKAECPRCAFVLDRGERDFWIGGYAVNLVMAELIVVLIMLAVVIATIPAVPWTFIQWGGAALAILMPVVTFPVSRSLWLAWDYCFRPVRD
jgi:uncharacterized protein (DUF983 family)